MKKTATINQIKGKLKSTRGESITETLAAVLISLIALCILASMVNSSAKLVAESETKMAAYYEESNRLSQRSASASDGEGRILVSEVGSLGSTSRIRLTADEALSGISVYYFVNDEIPASPVVSYLCK